jgi:PAS domain S-box-containing protein
MKRRLRLLLIDDQAEDRSLVLRELRQRYEDLQVKEITGAAEFEEALEEGDFDLVVTEYKLYWADGLQVLEQIKARRPECPVIMVTGSGNEEIAAAAMKAGADDYLNKSLHYLQGLLRTVRPFLAGGEQAFAGNPGPGYLRLFDLVPVALYRIDPRGKVLNANLALVQLLGYGSRKELLAVNSREFYARPEDRLRWRQLIKRDGAVRNFDVQVRRKDGSVLWVRNNAQAIRGEQGRIAWYEGCAEDITSRRQAEEALRESEAKYRLLFENNPQPMWVYDQETLAFLEVNRAAVAHYGYSREEFLAMTIRDIRPPEDVDSLLRRVSELTPGLDYSGDWRHRKKSGEIMDVEIISHGIIFNNRQARLVLVKDITARKRAQEALRESERFLASIFDSIQDGLFILDTDLTIVRANPTVEKWYAHAGTIVGKKCYETLYEAAEPCECCPAQQTLETGRAASLVVPKRGPVPDELSWLEVLTFPLTDIADGRVQGVIAYIRDISARRRAEEELKETNEFLRSLLEASAAGIVYLDKDGKVCIWNRAATSIFGWDAEEVLGRFPAPVPPEQESEFHQLRERVLAGEIVTGLETRRRRKDGSLIDVSISVAPVKDAKGEVQGTLALLTDITARKRAEDALHQKEEQFQQAQKMEAVGRLAGGVAHDFNNLLTAIMGYGELLLMRITDQGQARLVDQIMHVCERAATLIRQLLALSRRQPLRPVFLDLNKVVEGMEQLLQRVIGEDIQLHIDLEPGRPWVKADPGQLEQVIVNLAVNARDAMPQGGNLHIKTCHETLDEARAETIREARPGTFVVLQVADTGMGIEREVRERIFEPFYTTKGPGEGTGLGLATVYGIVTQHEGWINVSSEPGRGASFKIYFPVAEIEPEEKSLDALSLEELKGAGERILVVEDEDELRDLALRMLRGKGYQVSGAATVAEALEVFAREQGSFHLVFSDVVLSDQSGLQLVEELLARKPDLKALLTSGYADEKVQWPIIRAKKYPFLQKPYSLSNLLKTIAEVLKSGQAPGEKI